MRGWNLVLRSALLRASRRMRPPHSHKYSFAISRPDMPEVLLEISSPSIQRAQGRPGARCTRGLVCNECTRKRTRAYRFSGDTPAFPAQWLYGLLRALPGDQDLLVTVIPEKLASQELEANLEAFRTTRLRRTQAARPSRAPPTSTASRPDVRDVRETPL